MLFLYQAGVGSSLIMDRRDRYRSSYHEQFQYRIWSPRRPLSTEKVHLYYLAVFSIKLQLNNIFLSFILAKNSVFIRGDGRS